MQRSGAWKFLERFGEQNNSFRRKILRNSRRRESIVNSSQERWFDFVTVGGDLIQQLTAAEESRIAPDVIVNGEKDLGLAEGFAPIAVAIGKVFHYSSTIRLAVLGIAQVTEAVREFPSSNHVHRLQIIGELLVRI